MWMRTFDAIDEPIQKPEENVGQSIAEQNKEPYLVPTHVHDVVIEALPHKSAWGIDGDQVECAVAPQQSPMGWVMK
jgi:hypothetical protein